MEGRKTMSGARGSPAGGTQMVPGERAGGGGRRAGPGAAGIFWGRATPALPAGALRLGGGRGLPGARWWQPRVATSIAATAASEASAVPPPPWSPPSHIFQGAGEVARRGGNR